MKKSEFILYLQKLERKRKRQKEGYFTQKYQDSQNDWVFVSRDDEVIFHELDLSKRGKVIYETYGDPYIFSMDECEDMEDNEEMTYNAFIKMQKGIDDYFKDPEYVKRKKELDEYRKTPEYKKYRKESNERRIINEMSYNDRFSCHG